MKEALSVSIFSNKLQLSPCVADGQWSLPVLFLAYCASASFGVSMEKACVLILDVGSRSVCPNQTVSGLSFDRLLLPPAFTKLSF